MFSSKGESKPQTTLSAVAVAVIAAAIAAFALAGCNGSASGGGAELKVGSSVTIGSYEQDGDLSNGPEPIEWRVLSVEDGDALLISEYGLDCVLFNPSMESGNDWETSNLKSWLEDEFTANAFDSDDQQRIAEITCLSVEEAEGYFSSDDDRKCSPTEYAISQGVFESIDESGVDCCTWWLRSPGIKSNRAAVIEGDGSVWADGPDVDNRHYAVRPALHMIL